jgi:hypothetical protein
LTSETVEMRFLPEYLLLTLAVALFAGLVTWIDWTLTSNEAISASWSLIAC